ncbi:MAG: hypothetical protein CL607_20155 [Anaerolineaceae bacterium]|nr:hypothetical protein [Anaerolineaceae bacterium]
MSVIELIFENKVVLISLLAVIVPQLVALLLVLGMGITRLFKYLAEQKQQQREHVREMDLLGEQRSEVDMSGLDEVELDDEDAIGEPEEEEELEDDPRAADDNEPEGFDLNSESDMQSLLADVFVDDTMDQKAEMLLGEIEPMGVDMLLEFAEAINQRLPEAVGE